jgi:hypothetical protein
MCDLTPANGPDVRRLDSHDGCGMSGEQRELDFECFAVAIGVHNGVRLSSLTLEILVLEGRCHTVDFLTGNTTASRLGPPR